MWNGEQAVVVSTVPSCSLSNTTSVSDAGLSPSSSVPPYHSHATPPSSAAAAATDVRHNWTQRVMSSSSSDVQSAVDPRSRVAGTQQVPVHDPQVQSLTRGSSRTADERLGVWASGTAMASSMPSIPRECVPDTQTTVVPINTGAWLDSLQRKKNAHSISKSTEQMTAVPLNRAGDGPQFLAGGSGPGTHGRQNVAVCTTPSRSTLVGSNDSFAVTEASSRQLINSVSSQEHQKGLRDRSSSKKRHVRFELQPPTVQRIPDQRQRSRSRSDKRQDQAPISEPVAKDDLEGRTAASASGSLFSKFRRVVAGGVGALFGLSKQKNSSVDSSSDTQPACNGHMLTSSFEDMTEIERLATVADRIASERLHSAVMHGKLPTQNGYRSGCRSYGRQEPSYSNPDLANIEASFAGLSVSSGRTRPAPLASQKQQDFALWCGHHSNSVSEELCRLPSNACSSYVQFMPKSTTVPCPMIGSNSAVQPVNNSRKPSALSSMGNVQVIECQCGSRHMSGSEPMLPTVDSSNPSKLMAIQPGDVYHSENRLVQGNSHLYTEPSYISKSASQPTTLISQGQMCEHSSVAAVPKQDVELHKSVSDASRVMCEKPQLPPKVFQRFPATPFREGLLPPPAGVEDFHIRRPVGTAGNISQSGPMKATVPFSKQLHNDSTARSSSNATRFPPPPPPTRSFAAAGSCGLSTESDGDARRLTLQELSALVDRELQANERLEMSSDTAAPQQPFSSATECSTRISNHADFSRVISSSTCSRTPAVQSKNDIDAQLKRLGFDEAIWNVELDAILAGSGVSDKNPFVTDDDEEDSASTLTDCSGSVVTVTSTPTNRRTTSPILGEDDRLQPSNDAVSGRGSIESVRSVDDPLSRLSRPSTLGSSSSYSLPAISTDPGARPVDGDPAHHRCSSTNIPVPRTCRQDVSGRWRLPAAFSFNQLVSGTAAAAATCSPYNSKSSGFGSLVDSGSVPNSPL